MSWHRVAATAGGGIYKFVPTNPYTGTGQPPVTMPMLSPLVSGDIFGLRVAANGSSNWGQGAEIGKGRWTAVDKAPAGVVDAAGNTILRNAQVLQKFTGYYRPEDMDIDPEAAKDGIFRACWANTGRLNSGGGTTLENSAVYGEVMCLVEEASAAAPTGTIPVVTRFIAGSQQMRNARQRCVPASHGEPGRPRRRARPASQPRRGRSRAETTSGSACRTATTMTSSPMGACGSRRSGTPAPSRRGFIFTASGESAYVNIQHRAVNDAAGPGNHGALVKISGFKVNGRHHGNDDDHGHGH